jgi:hypothetical protein
VRGRIHMLDVDEHPIRPSQHFQQDDRIRMAGGFDGGVNVIRDASSDDLHKKFVLEQRLAAGKGDAALIPPEPLVPVQDPHQFIHGVVTTGNPKHSAQTRADTVHAVAFIAE